MKLVYENVIRLIFFFSYGRWKLIAYFMSLPTSCTITSIFYVATEGRDIPHTHNVTLRRVFGVKSTSRKQNNNKKTYKIDYYYLHSYAYSKKTKQVTKDFSIINL